MDIEQSTTQHAKSWRLDLDQHHKKWLGEIAGDLEGKPPTQGGNLSNMLDPASYCPLIDACLELSGGGSLFQIRGVYLPHGRGVGSHRHLSMRVMLYMLHEHSCTLRIQDPNEYFPTKEGLVVHVPQGRLHSVSMNNHAPRITIAVMLRP